MPDVLSKLIYPIDKSQLALVRFVHFLALAVVDDTLRRKFAGDPAVSPCTPLSALPGSP
jgi:hypothetical protein